MARVSTANPYDLLNDTEDLPRSKEQKPKKEAPKKEAPAKPAEAPKPKPAAAPEQAKAAPQPAAAATQKPAAPRPAQQAGTPPRDANTNLVEREKEYHPRGGADKHTNRAPKTGAGAPRSGDKQRPFDRKSGTGRPANEVKKGGQGKANWGGDVDTKEAAEAAKEAEKPTTEEEEKDEEGEKKEGAEGEKEGEEEKKEGEEKKDEKPAPPPELTLDEYLAQLKAKAPKFEPLKPRAVESDFTGFTEIARDDDDDAHKKSKKDKKKGEKKAATEEKLAEQIIAFPSYHEQQYSRERRGPRREGTEKRERREGEDRPPRRDRRDGDDRRGPRRDNRGPRDAQAPAAPVTDFKAAREKDFPALAHGADQSVKA